MSSEISYDPVTAIDENEAVGSIANIFEDIRDTMNIPLVTSIWRGLAGMENSLDKVWNMAKPIYEQENSEGKLNEIINTIQLSIPKPLTKTEIINSKLSKNDWKNILIVLKAYNRSNGMNMVVLHAMIKLNFPKIPRDLKKNKIVNLSVIPELLSKDDIDKKTWNLIRDINSISAPNGRNSHVATLWRHLAHWPKFLALINKKLISLNNDGIIQSLLKNTSTQLNENGLNLNYKSSFEHDLSARVYSTIKDYVFEETQVIRMVVIGHIIQHWIKAQPRLEIFGLYQVERLN